MNAISPYDEALLIIRQNPGTGGAGGLAKLLLSLYNDQCGFSFAECAGGLDQRLTGVALRMVQDYAARGETEDLRSAGKILAEDLYPGLWEMGVAMRDAREAVRQRWKREELERESAKIAEAEKAFLSGVGRRTVPSAIAEEMIMPENGTVSAYYYLAGDWHNKELPLERVSASIRENGTGFMNCDPESGYMLGVPLDGRLYYVQTDYDVRERYLDEIKSQKQN
ncbi:hypothetical protein [Massilia aerilata]|uniref:Uncharacterized protein n=1 Tax=Massilia aerilata TaxID=453817 RepID=A0ABW0S1H6_9BURK